MAETKEKKTKKVLLSFTETAYERLEKLQNVLGKKTLTSTIEFFIEQGIIRTREEFSLGLNAGRV